MTAVFNIARCDLCHSEEIEEVLATGSKLSMTSDYKVRNGELVEVICATCGLVRAGQETSSDELITQYRSDYFLSKENLFYTKDGPVPRAQVFADWIAEAFGDAPWQAARKCLEIGASNGDLLAEFARRQPATQFHGLELSEAAAKNSRAKGFEIFSGELGDYAERDFDLIYAIAVLEHTTSPTQFLREIHRRLKPDGFLILCQPTQEVYSHDVFFVDHLFHFGAQHVREYAAKCGFVELERVVSHPHVPGFSLHWWQKIEGRDNYEWSSADGRSKCKDSFRDIMRDIRSLNEKLKALKQSGQKTAVFGVNELFSLLYAYSELSEFPISCGLDDYPDKEEYERFKFPVVKPEECLKYGVEHVLLTMNKAHYEYAGERIAKMGLKVHEVFH